MMYGYDMMNGLIDIMNAWSLGFHLPGFHFR